MKYIIMMAITNALLAIPLIELDTIRIFAYNGRTSHDGRFVHLLESVSGLRQALGVLKPP